LDYVDLYLIHWPVAFKNMTENVWSESEETKTRCFAEGFTLTDTWRAMEKLVDLKLTRSIGISNFSPSQTDEILSIARIKPAVNQVELHPYFNQSELREYSAKNNIILTSYCPLSNLNPASGPDSNASALYNATIQAIATSKSKSPAQIIIRWHLQHGLTVIPKTVTPARLVENAQVFDFTLSDEEMQQIDQLGQTHRVRMVNPPFMPQNKKVFDD
jgi:diketogulonate reductase-like aldo/keto reductase